MLIHKMKSIAKKLLGVSINRFELRTRDIILEISVHKAETKKIAAEAKKTATETKDKVNTLIKENKILKSKIEALEQVIMMNSVGVTAVKRNPEIIVSMTSFPARIRFVPKTMERLMNQTVKPDRIILWLSRDQFPNEEQDLPIRLIEMKAQGLEIEWCDGDIRSYKKFIPALQKYPDSILIIVDDDLIYDTNMVETLMEGHRLYPNAIVASRTHRVTYSESGVIDPYMNWDRQYLNHIFEVRRDLFFTGGAGTLIPPHSFTEEIFNYNVIRELCPYTDDAWLNVMARLNDTPIVHTAQHALLTYTPGSQVDCLFTINRTETDIQLKRLMDYYHVDFYEPNAN